MYAGGGRLADALGTRIGFAAIMIFWSLACASHALAANFAMLAGSRFLLGMGEGGGFPAATRAVSEGFAVKHRATAMGIINAGTAVGGIVAPPLIALIVSYLSWRWVFVVTGAAGLLWTTWWLRSYTSAGREESGSNKTTGLPANNDANGLDSIRWIDLLKIREAWGLMFAKFSQRRGLVLLFVLAAEVSVRRAQLRHQGGRRIRLDSVCRRSGVGCLCGGWFSSYLVRRGVFSRLGAKIGAGRRAPR